MLLGNIRPDLHSTCRSSRSAPHVTSSPSVQTPISTPSNVSSNNLRTPITSQQTMMNYARMSYRYTTVTLLSLRPQPELSVFPDHLVERRFLDEENYIDLDRMLVEKAGKFRLESSYGMLDGAGDGLIMPSRVHKYDFSDPVVIEKVKNRRPKDPMTPHQVAALTSVVTRHQPSTVPTPLLSTLPIPPSPHVWVDDYSHRQAQLQRQPHRNHFPPQPSMPYQRQNPNQCETYANPTKSISSHFSPELQSNHQTVPILQRLFQAQQQQQNEQRRVHTDQIPLSPMGCYQKGLSTFATPTTPQISKPTNTFAWPFSTNENQNTPTHPLHLSMSTQATVKQNQNVLTQLINEHLRCSTTLQTPVTASGSNKLYRTNSDEDDDEQNFYSAPPSPTEMIDSATPDNPEQNPVYSQAVLLNTLIRNMVKEQEQRDHISSSASNESCLTNESQSTKTHSEHDESYTEMYNLVRLLSPGVKSVAQQELLQYLEQGCAVEREEMLRLVASLSIDEQNSLKPILLRLINEQTDVLKQQQEIQQGQTRSNYFHHHHRVDQTRSPLESWFGSEIYKNAFPRMPSSRVVSACDLEQSRLSQQN